jgi:signal transduction histidine kinase
VYVLPSFLAAYLAAFGLGLALTVYLTSTIVMHLRQRDADLVRAREQLQERSAALETANGRLRLLARRRTEHALRVAHELRAPAAAMKSVLDVLLRGYADDQQSMLEIARDNSVRLLDLVNDLLYLGHVKEVGHAVDVTAVRIDDVLRDTMEAVRPMATQQSITLTMFLQPYLPTVRANPEYVRQILVNLLDNAIKYTPARGAVEAELRHSGDRVVCTVSDTGIGIRSEDVPHVFEEFFRAPNAKQSQRTGTGLGLAIVKQIVDLYGGDIAVESQIGKGTRVTFSLPLAKEAAAASSRAAEGGSASASRPG